MRYIGGGGKEHGCLFCTRLASDDDVASLILHRGEHFFTIMNLFPYNTGHVMIVPNEHQPDLDNLSNASLSEIALFLPVVTRALKRVLHCQGFNIGLNIGSVAGAGVAEHLHQHVVPRWEGDANFMPILARTTVIPEMIPVTYAKIRAELVRELDDAASFECVVIDSEEQGSVWLNDGRIPTFRCDSEKPVWQTAVDELGTSDAEILGWSGPSSSINSTALPGLIVRSGVSLTERGWIKFSLEGSDDSSLSLESQGTIHRLRTLLHEWPTPNS